MCGYFYLACDSHNVLENKGRNLSLRVIMMTCCAKYNQNLPTEKLSDHGERMLLVWVTLRTSCYHSSVLCETHAKTKETAENIWLIKTTTNCVISEVRAETQERNNWASRSKQVNTEHVIPWTANSRWGTCKIGIRFICRQKVIGCQARRKLDTWLISYKAFCSGVTQFKFRNLFAQQRNSLICICNYELVNLAMMLCLCRRATGSTVCYRLSWRDFRIIPPSLKANPSLLYCNVYCTFQVLIHSIHTITFHIFHAV